MLRLLSLLLDGNIKLGWTWGTEWTGWRNRVIENRQLTPHFSLYDLTQTTHADLQEMNRTIDDLIVSKLDQVANLGEQMIAILGVPLIATSGYRCPALNVAVGSSLSSQHLKAEAFDSVPKGMPIDEAFRKLRQAAKDGKISFGQLIWEKQNRGYLGATEWIHASLGIPYRDDSRCGQILTMCDGQYQLIDQIKAA